jgi:hypothetical protein
VLATVLGFAAAFRGAGVLVGLGTSNGIASGIRSGAGAIGGAMASLVGIVLGYAGAMRGAGVLIGIALGQGIAAGILSQLGAVRSAAAALVSAAAGAGRATGEIKSPSQLMAREVGLPLALGVAEGMYAGISTIYQAGSAMIPNLSGSYAGGGLNGGMRGGGGSVVINFNGDFHGAFNRDQMNEWAASDLLPTIERQSARRQVALGVTNA